MSNNTPSHLEWFYDEKPEDDGNFYIETPFWGWYKVTEEEYNKEMERVAAMEKKQMEERHEREEKAQHLHDVGHTGLDYRAGMSANGGYEDRLTKVLDDNHISHIEEIPQHMAQLRWAQQQKLINEQELTEKASSTALTTASDIFTSFSVKVHEAKDMYETAILSLIEQYEKIIPKRVLTDREYSEIYRLFKLGHITNPEIYYRFEKLKKTEKIYYYQRCFTYGSKANKDDNPEDVVREEKEILDSFSISMLYHGLRRKDIAIKEIDPTEVLFHEKISKCYKAALKWQMWYRDISVHITSYMPDQWDIFDTLLPDEQSDIKEKIKNLPYMSWYKDYWEKMLPWDRNVIVDIIRRGKDINKYAEMIKSQEKAQVRYNDMSPHKMQEVFAFSRQELHELRNEAKKEFVLGFFELCENLTVESFDFEEYGINREHIDLIVSWVEKAGPSYGVSQERIAGLRELLRAGLTALLQKEIVNLRTGNVLMTEHHGKVTRDRRGPDRLRNPIMAMKKLGYGEDAIIKDRDENKDGYVQESPKERKANFVARRKEQVIQGKDLDVSSEEAVRPQIISQATQKLVEVYGKQFKKNKKKYGSLLAFSTISPAKMKTLLNQWVLFADGYFTVVKGMIPSPTQRRKFWDEVRKNILYNVLFGARQRLMSPQTVTHQDYLSLDALSKLYKKYGGRAADIPVRKKQIDKNYFEYIKSHISKWVQRNMGIIERYLQGKTKKKIEKVYDEFQDIETYLHTFLALYIAQQMEPGEAKRYQEENRTVEHFAINRENYAGQYPGNYLVGISRMRYLADWVEARVPADLLAEFISVFQKTEQLKEKFFRSLVEERVQVNALPWGKLQRLVEDQIAENDQTENTTQSIIDYIVENLEGIVLHDFYYMLLGMKHFGGFSWKEEELIKDAVIAVLKERQSTLASKNMLLEQQDDSDKIEE